MGIIFQMGTNISLNGHMMGTNLETKHNLSKLNSNVMSVK